MREVVAEANLEQLLTSVTAGLADHFFWCGIHWVPCGCDFREDNVSTCIQLQLCGDRTLHVVRDIAANDVTNFPFSMDPELQAEGILAGQPEKVSVIQLRQDNDDRATFMEPNLELGVEVVDRLWDV